MTEGGGPSAERRADRAALIIAAGLFGLAAILAWDASRLGNVATYARIGPQTYPYAVALCLAGLGIWTVIEALRGDFPPRERQEFRSVLWIVGGLLAQLVLLRLVGFSIATGILFGFVATGLGRKPLWVTIPLGLVLALGLWLIFARGLALTLPAGPLEAAAVAGVGTIIEMVVLGWNAIASFVASFR